MTRGSFADTEWRGSVPIVISYLVTLMFVTQVASAAFTIFFEGISLSDEGAPSAYGFHVRGNLSFFSEAVINRTDSNASSPTYGMWTPPPGAPRFRMKDFVPTC